MKIVELLKKLRDALPCGRCGGSGILVTRGERIPRSQLLEEGRYVEWADQMVQGGFAYHPVKVACSCPPGRELDPSELETDTTETGTAGPSAETGEDPTWTDR